MRYKNIQQYINKIEKIILEKGGLVLSAITNSKIKISIQCEKGHIFEMTPNRIQQGCWCPHFKKVPFETILKYVTDKSGFVSGTYIDMRHKLNFTCDKGHSWKATPASIMLNKTWCPYCANHIKLDITIFHQIALQRGGVCLSTNYSNQQDKLKFQCANNHVWDAYAKHIRAGHWCPHCYIYKGEEIVRTYLENIFNTKFPRYRADWLINKSDYRLELDGYCTTLGIAFEHHGQQHHGQQHYGVNIFRLNNFDKIYKKSIQNDDQKRVLCQRFNIKLIEIPAVGVLTKIEDLPTIITQELQKFNINIPKKEINLENIIYSISKKSLEEMNEIAIVRGGKCLSKIYVNSKTHLLFECKLGHRWEAIPSNIKSGNWCPKCKINPHVKLTWSNVCDIRNEWKNNKCTQKFLAKKYGVSADTISDIIHDRTWK